MAAGRRGTRRIATSAVGRLHAAHRLLAGRCNPGARERGVIERRRMSPVRTRLRISPAARGDACCKRRTRATYAVTSWVAPWGTALGSGRDLRSDHLRAFRTGVSADGRRVVRDRAFVVNVVSAFFRGPAVLLSSVYSLSAVVMASIGPAGSARARDRSMYFCSTSSGLLQVGMGLAGTGASQASLPVNDSADVATSRCRSKTLHDLAAGR